MSFALPKDQEEPLEGVLLQPPKASRRRKHFDGTPLQIFFDGGFAQGIGVAGFKVVGPGGDDWVKVGTYDVGFTNNQSEFIAAKLAL